MEPKDYLPEHDQDLLLAKAIGKVNEGSLSIQDINDPLMDILQSYKTSTSQEHISIDTSALWNSIDKNTRPVKATVTPLHRKRNTYSTWAIAASILIAVFAGMFWLINLNSPTLIGETDSQLATITLKDGSSVTLRPYSKLWETTYSDDVHQYSLTGEGYFEVMSNPDRNFVVEAGDGRVTVLGTKFVLSDWGATSSVFLEEGSVRFEALDGSSSIILSPGEKSSIANGTVQSNTTATIEIHKDWLNNVIVADGLTVASVFAELEQHYNIQLGSEVNIFSDSLGGSYNLDSIEQTLNDIGTVLDGTFTKVGTNHYRFVSLK